MTREYGYIKLDDIVSPLTVKTDEYMTDRIKFSFTYNGATYYFKSLLENDYYRELIASFLLDDFNISHVEYDLATVLGNKGYISKDFKRKNTKYLTIQDLLIEYYKYLKEKDFSYDDNTYLFNSLSNIWNALEWHLRNNLNKEEIIASVMDKLTDIFIADIIMAQADRHARNLNLEENDNKLDVAPLYDNEGFALPEEVGKLYIDDTNYETIYDKVLEFLLLSDRNYKDKISSKLWIIDKDNLEKVFRKVEKKLNIFLEEEVKNRYLEIFKEHKEKLEEVLEKDNIRKR